MKAKYLRAGMLSVAAGGLALAAGCVVFPRGRVGLVPIVVAPAPVCMVPPPVEVEAGPMMVPDGYAWDGYEYVGFVGDQYYYLGPGNFWLLAEPWRLDRFHGWERGHPDCGPAMKYQSSAGVSGRLAAHPFWIFQYML